MFVKKIAASIAYYCRMVRDAKGGQSQRRVNGLYHTGWREGIIQVCLRDLPWYVPETYLYGTGGLTYMVPGEMS